VGKRIRALSVVIFAVVATVGHAATPFAFTQTPRDPTNQTSATFAWTGTGPFKCSIDGAAFQTCTLGGHRLRNLATINLSGKTDHEATIDVKLPLRQLERDGEGLLVLLQVSGKPRLSGVGFTN
jgi:hypothetical protein